MNKQLKIGLVTVALGLIAGLASMQQSFAITGTLTSAEDGIVPITQFACINYYHGIWVPATRTAAAYCSLATAGCPTCRAPVVVPLH